MNLTTSGCLNSFEPTCINSSYISPLNTSCDSQILKSVNGEYISDPDDLPSVTVLCNKTCYIHIVVVANDNLRVRKKTKIFYTVYKYS